MPETARPGSGRIRYAGSVLALALLVALAAPGTPSAHGASTPEAVGPATPAAAPAPLATLADRRSATLAEDPRVSTVTRRDLGRSYRSGCPVGPESLRRLTLDHVDLDGAPRRGRIIVHADEVPAVLRIVDRLTAAGFRIARMRPAARYGGDVRASEEANNTVGFACARKRGGGWTRQSYGRAIMVNPVQNPRVVDGVASPAAGAAYLHRSDVRPGMLVAGSAALRAFTAERWQRLGRLADPDYMQLRRPRAPALDADVDTVTAADLGGSYRRGCPVGPESLRRIRLTYWGFDQSARRGAVVVHADEVSETKRLFGALLKAQFPIARLQPANRFGGDLRRSARADNTVGFACARRSGGGWSRHAYGRALRINPVENPRLRDGKPRPASGAAYVDRSVYRTGMVRPGGPVVAAFARERWSWSGRGDGDPNYAYFARPRVSGFSARVHEVGARRLGRSWRPGCPVEPHSLRRVDLDYWGFDNRSHRGRVVVHADEVTEVVWLFADLYTAQFPIRRMRTADRYRNDMARSERANNTVGFSCALRDGEWTRESFGRALRINPVRNPRVDGRRVSPRAGSAYINRRFYSTGMVLKGSVVHRAAARQGWAWAGAGRARPDYMYLRRPAAPGLRAEVDRVTRRTVPHSYRSGCPVGPSDLRRVRLNHWGYDNEVHRGELIVHRSVVGDVTRVFRRALRAQFPVHRMRKVDHYRGSDEAAMKDDNTSAFNCRKVVGNPYRLSQHSYGNAIDVNTFRNPYVTSSRVYPPGSGGYLDRSPYRTGMILPGGPLAEAFRVAGWRWGARWANPDYQHFSSNGG